MFFWGCDTVERIYISFESSKTIPVKCGSIYFGNNFKDVDLVKINKEMIKDIHTVSNIIPENKDTKLISSIMKNRFHPIMMSIYKMASFNEITMAEYLVHLELMKIFYDSLITVTRAVYEEDYDDEKEKDAIVKDFTSNVGNIVEYLTNISNDINKVFQEEKLKAEFKEKAIKILSKEEKRKVYTADNFMTIRMFNNIRKSNTNKLK